MHHRSRRGNAGSAGREREGRERRKRRSQKMNACEGLLNTGEDVSRGGSFQNKWYFASVAGDSAVVYAFGMKTMTKPKAKTSGAKSKVKSLPKRSEVRAEDCWNLG